MSEAGGRSLEELAADFCELQKLLEAAELTISSQAELIDELRRKIADLEKRLGKNSSNSSLPPSSDRFQKPAKTESPNRKARRALARLPGKQPGTEGKHLAQVENPDVVITHTPGCCDGCGGDLAGSPVEGTEIRQVFDVPDPAPLQSAEHRGESRRCRCGTVTKAQFPPEARGYACYGKNIRAAALYLMSYHHQPMERTQIALRDLYGITVSTGFLDQVFTEAAAQLGDFMAAVLDALLDADVVHVDETFDFVGTDKIWFHVACNELYTLLHADVTRGKDGTERTGLFPDFQGVAVHDRLVQYFGYDNSRHAVCAAHLLRDLASVAMVASQEPWAAAMTALLLEMKLCGEQVRSAGGNRIDEKTLAVFFARYDNVVEEAFSANPEPLRGRARDYLEKESFNLAVALRDRKDDIVRFASDLRVPFTNNRAETDVRMVKLHSKISGPFRAMHGAERFASVRSYIQTAMKHGLGPMAVLAQLFAGGAWIPQRT